MKLAIIGSRNISVDNLDSYISDAVTEIVSGGAIGVDSFAREYANRKEIPLTEFLPNYSIYGKYAPLKRNQEIAEYADAALVFWDGKSKGTLYTINFFKKLNKSLTIILK